MPAKERNCFALFLLFRQCTQVSNNPLNTTVWLFANSFQTRRARGMKFDPTASNAWGVLSSSECNIRLKKVYTAPRVSKRVQIVKITLLLRADDILCIAQKIDNLMQLRLFWELCNFFTIVCFIWNQRVTFRVWICGSYHGAALRHKKELENTVPRLLHPEFWSRNMNIEYFGQHTSSMYETLWVLLDTTFRASFWLKKVTVHI